MTKDELINAVVKSCKSDNLTKRLAGDVVDACSAKGVVPGVPLGRFDAVRENELLICVTEIHTRDDIERLVQVIAEACS